MNIGPKQQLSYWAMGVYKGLIDGLQGERAIVSWDNPSDEWVHAQFNEHLTGYAFGWWRFKRKEFDIEGH